MVIVPVLWLALLLDETEQETVPLPLPELPDVIVIQPALLTAVHEQPLWVVTLTLLLPPPEPKDLLVGEME